MTKQSELVKPNMEFLEDAANYFSSRDTKGEDKAHWANVYNADNCRKAAQTITDQAALIDELVGALEPACAAIKKSRHHSIDGEKFRRILIAQSAENRIDKALDKAEQFKEG